MLKKLFKHELMFLLKWGALIWACILGLAILCRISTALFTAYMENTDVSNNDLLFSICLSSLATINTIFYLAAGISITFSIILVAIRFYKNLFTQEGYFSFCIPITAKQHIWCKLLCGVLFIITSCLITFSSICIAISEFSGEITGDIFDSFIGKINGAEIVHFVLYIIEGLTLIVTIISSSVLIFYCAISFGQGFKNKIGGSIISYMIINAILSAVQSFLVIFVMLISILSVPDLGIDISRVDPLWIIHVILLIAIGIYVGLSTIFFKLTEKRITTKLNLN